MLASRKKPVAPTAELVHSVLVGSTLIATSGYSYDDWKGSFYPEDLPKSEYLRYYSLFFPFVEL
ncbi:MAG TPA: hypothetical protein PLC54_06360, partial [Spirochaetales bacterium]|nr:hypothetical protein [Spirochaetales bacterium]